MPHELLDILKKVKINTENISLFDENALNNFVTVLGHSSYTIKEGINLEEKILHDFLSNVDNGVLLLMGDAGAGKTLFGQQLFQVLMAQYDNLKIIPLWIPLVKVLSPKKLLREHCCDTLRLSSDEFDMLISSGSRFLLILDGFDEMEDLNRNLYQDNGFDELPIQAIITCRRDAIFRLKIKYSLIFRPKQGRTLHEYYLFPFNPGQVDAYIEKHLQNSPELDWTVQQFREKIHLIPGLDELITNPFLLKIVLDTLPEVIDKYHDIENEVEKIRLTRYDIYDIYTKKYFLRQKKKLEERNALTPAFYGEYKDEPIEVLMANFSHRLALAMWQHHVHYISNSLTQLEELDNWQGEFFDDENVPFLSLIRSGCPLVSICSDNPIEGNLIGFLHYSLQDFFVAQHIINDTLINSWILAGINLNSEVIEKQDMLDFLANKVVNKEFKDNLFEVIKISSYEPSIAIAALNAINILSRADVNFSGCNFKRVRIGGVYKLLVPEKNNPTWGYDFTGEIWANEYENSASQYTFYGANLANCNFDSANFSEADLRGVNFSQSYLSRVNFNGACLDGVEFGELPILINSFPIKTVCFTPNNKYLVTGDELGNIITWSTETFKKIEKIFNGSISDGSIFRKYFDRNEITSIRISWDGKYQAVASHCDGKVRIFIKNKLHYIIAADNLETSCVDFQPNSYIFASGGFDHNIKIWDAVTGILLHQLDEPSHIVSCIKYNKRGEFLAAGDWNGKLYFWDTEDYSLVNVIEIDEKISSIDYNADDTLIATAHNQSIKIWNTNTYACIYKVPVPDTTPCLSFANLNPELLASGHINNIVLLWDLSVAIPKAYLQLFGHKDSVTNIQFSADDSIIASGGDDGTVHFWKPNFSQNHYSIEKSEILGLWFNLENTYMLSVENNNKVILWDATDYTILYEKYLQPIEFKQITLTSSGQVLFTQVHNLILWDLQEDSYREVYKTEKTFYGAFLVNTDLIILEAIPSLRQSNGLSVSAISANRITFNTEPKMDFSLRVVSLDFQETTVQIDDLRNDIQILEISQDGCLAIIGYNEPPVKIEVWCLKTGVLERTFIFDYEKEKEGTVVKALCLTSDRKYLLTANSHLIRVWNMHSGMLIKKLKGHTSPVISLDVSIDGRYLVSGCGSSPPTYNTKQASNATIRIFDLQNFKCILTLTGHQGPISCIKISSDNKVITSYDPASRSMFLWEVDLINHTYCLKKTSSGISLHSENISLLKASGLKKSDVILLNHLSQTNSIQNQPSRCVSNKILRERNKQIYVGQDINYNAPNGNSYVISPNQWIISLIREKKPCLESSQNHTWLLIQGLDDNYYTVNQELHFYIDDKAASCMGLVGKGKVLVKSRSPWDLKWQEKAGNLVSRTWSLSKNTAEEMMEKVRIQSGRGYIISGRTPGFFGRSSLNCLSWCLEQLKAINIPEILPLSQSDSSIKNFLFQLQDFTCAIPKHYLPDNNVSENELFQETGGCALA